MAFYRPDTSLRESALAEGSSAILFVDVQNFNCSKSGAIYRNSLEEQRQDSEYFFDRVDAISGNWASLQAGFREAGADVLYTVIQSLTLDGRDRSLDYKLSGFHVPPGSADAQMLSCILPAEGEIVLPKTSSSVFSSTAAAYLLRNLGVRHLALCGCVTDQCVEHAVRDACDAGFLVTLVTDACATYSQERHDASLRAVAGYCRQRTAAQVLGELRAWRRRP